MADIQKQLREFDEQVRLKKYGENKELRDKRDSILKRLRENPTVPSFEELNQGSYAMGTGIKPADGDYDIDVGLRFNVQKADYPNPVDLKELVANALEGHTELGTKVRRSCVTVTYKKAGEKAFHVDLAVYAWDNIDTKQRLFISKGKLGSDEKNRSWESSEPQTLLDTVDGKFKGDEQDQFLRVIRLLKRWKSEKFPIEGSSAPTGIALTALALKSFLPVVAKDAFTNKASPDDRKAMRDFVDQIINQFVRQTSKRSDGLHHYRLTVSLPVAPGNDLFEKMTDEQMTQFRDRLLELRDVLDEVTQEVDLVAACKALKKHFGDEFPVPDKSETAEKRGRAVVSSGVSA